MPGSHDVNASKINSTNSLATLKNIGFHNVVDY